MVVCSYGHARVGHCQALKKAKPLRSQDFRGFSFAAMCAVSVSAAARWPKLHNASKKECEAGLIRGRSGHMYQSITLSWVALKRWLRTRFRALEVPVDNEHYHAVVEQSPNGVLI